jgi:hypothetical protein
MLDLDPFSFAPALFIKAISPPRSFLFFFPLFHIFVPVKRDIGGPTLLLFSLPTVGPIIIPVHRTPCPLGGE